MEEQTNILKIPIGTIETQKAEPEKVKIVKVRVDFIENAKSNKVICKVSHSKVEDLEISSVKFESKGNLKVSGLWVKTDKEDKLQKGTALVNMLSFLGCADIEALEGREVDTVEDDKGYLCFKAY